MVVTVRTPGGAPDPVTALWKDDLADRIDLDPLAEPDVEELAAGVLGGPVAGASVRRLWEASGGNALYIRELLMGAADSGAVAEVDGVWTLRLPLTASDRLVELVALRLTGLAPETAGVIELLAAGEPLGLQLLENLTAR